MGGIFGAGAFELIVGTFFGVARRAKGLIRLFKAPLKGLKKITTKEFIQEVAHPTQNTL